ncbi:hypothetical protein PGT21_029058 [Puccinia graminis f. sp. tritici]|uniref:AAA+ ATPase domain-containing protein n=2 Tax=Puccinia graminis f. sp. tritici TaxID=56615 RepID=A0A5B0NV98_PUCGR|nr:hypothetical protein PGT21_029058 [Puccinia graminis f. sp. tritici]KAA1127985.1 hypothetical protein PGTUg99_013431 [Puccinia graminis f. sp. tritici]
MISYFCCRNTLHPLKQDTASFLHQTFARTFYNRSLEVEHLTTRLKAPPQFTVLLGPPSSGKTALARHVATQTRLNNTPEFHPLIIDLREVNTSEKGSFLNAFIDDGLRTAVRDTFWGFMSNVAEVAALGVSANLCDSHPSPQKAATVFRELGSRLKPFSLSHHGERPPVLIIDEANAFKQIDDEATGAFLSFAVRITKQESKMHVIFTSSDSFFENWLKKRINPTHFNTLVVGDLPREEAYKYLLHLVETHPYLSSQNKNCLKSVNFDVPFRITGGRMFFIKQYVEQVHMSGYFEDPMDFEPTLTSCTTLEDDFRGKAKTYKTKEALRVCQLLLNSNGYISFAGLTAELSNTVVEEMIERNFLHYQLLSKFSRDLIPPPMESVLTAQSEPARRAMEALSKRYEQY